MKKTITAFCLLLLIPEYNLCQEKSIFDTLNKDVIRYMLEQKALDIINNGQNINEIKKNLNILAATCKQFREIINPKNKKLNSAFIDKKNSILASLQALLDTKIKQGNYHLELDITKNINNKDMHNALHWTAANGLVDIAKLLIDNGANIDLPDKMYSSALKVACIFKKIEMIQLLLKNGADTNITNNDGYAALMYAVINDDIETVELLIKNGANVNIKNKFGRTALNIATDRECALIINLLKDRGAA